MAVLLRIILTVPHILEHGDDLVRRLESAGCEGWRLHRREGLEFLSGIGAQIYLGALERGMAKPEGDLPHVVGGVERVHGASVTQDVGRDALFED